MKVPEDKFWLYSATQTAADALRSAGHHVEPADVPGLWRVSGYPELTVGQMIAVARNLKAKP